MSDDGPTFGGRLYSELRQLSGYDLITGMMNYKSIQQLKVADRDDTLKLFRGSSYEVMEMLRTKEPEDVAQYLVAKAKEAKKSDTNFDLALLLMINSG